MISFTVQSYEVMAFTGNAQPLRIFLRDNNDRYRGYIDFIDHYTDSHKYMIHSNGIINAFMPLKKFPAILDILRNEKPVYFALSERYEWAALKTGQEPTGEEEAP